MFLAQQDGDWFTFKPLFEDHGIPLAVMGILVVFMALVLVAVFITLLPRVLEWTSKKELERTDPLPAKAAADAELPEELVVIIAAAVAETMRAPHRIVRIRGWSPEDVGWSLEGRMKHHQSHKLKPRDPR